jgi:lactoylglutathione lyase
MEPSVRYYVDGLGFTMIHNWIVDEKVRWCWLKRGGAAVMLQEFAKPPASKVGVGVSLAFQCEDALALYREFTARGLQASEPQVGNSMWVTFLSDPDGYRLEFASMTDVPGETRLSELA